MNENCPECGIFPEASFSKSICEGRSGRSLEMTNKFRERHRLPPLDSVQVLAAFENTKKFNINEVNDITKIKGCSSCGSTSINFKNAIRVPRLNGHGPGSCLLKMFKAAGFPTCEACSALAAKMDMWNVEGCKLYIKNIIADILPRALEWEAEKVGWLSRLIPTAITEGAISLLVERAIKEASKYRKYPQRRIRAQRNRKAILNTLPRIQKVEMAFLKYLSSNPSKASPDILKFRQDTCNQCFHNVNEECNICNCHLQPNSASLGKLHWQAEQCPISRWFRHSKRRCVFTQEPTRHLIYHIYPRHSPKIGDCIWHWNLQQLAKRISVFNGERLIAVATDEKSASLEEVQQYLKNCKIDCILTQYSNVSEMQEMVSFSNQLKALKHLGKNDLVFRAHAKGVKHDNFFECGRRPWVEALYVTALDDLRCIWDALESHIFAGSFRFHNAFNSGRTWCYCGSFYWFRAGDVYRRSWEAAITNKFWGVEAWPGRLVNIDDAACLLYDYTTTFTALANIEKWISEGIWQELDAWTSSRNLPKVERI